MNKVKQGLTPGFWGAIAGAAAVAIVGFNWGGWVTASSAREMVDAAVVDRLIPICVGQFDADANKSAKLVQIKETDAWKQADYVVEQGWAVMPGAKEADRDVARGCANKIIG